MGQSSSYTSPRWWNHNHLSLYSPSIASHLHTYIKHTSSTIINVILYPRYGIQFIILKILIRNIIWRIGVTHSHQSTTLYLNHPNTQALVTPRIPPWPPFGSLWVYLAPPSTCYRTTINEKPVSTCERWRHSQINLTCCMRVYNSPWNPSPHCPTSTTLSWGSVTMLCLVTSSDGSNLNIYINVSLDIQNIL